MIGVKKKAMQKKERRGFFTYSSFGEKGKGEGNLFPKTYGNCDCRGGRLHAGIGVKSCQDQAGENLTVDLGSDVALHIFFVTMNRDGATDTSTIYAVGTDGYLYERKNTGMVVKRILLGGEAEHFALKAENKAIYNFFCGKKGAYVTLSGDVYTSLFVGSNLGGCLCGKRFLLLTASGEIIYTAPLKPNVEDEDIHGSGKIYLPAGYGAPVGIKAFGNSAYIFFEKGIGKLTLSATASEHTLKMIPYQGGRICVRAQAVTSDGIIFLAREGAYYLRNDKIERICEYLSIGPCVTDKVSRVGYCEDEVIISYHQENGKSTEMKYLAVYTDGADGYFTDTSTPLGGNEYTSFNGGIYHYVKDCKGVQHGKTPCFISEETHLGERKAKRLKNLVIKGAGTVMLEITYGKGIRHPYVLSLGNGVAKTRLWEKGESFSFSFILTAGSRVDSLEIEYVTE